MKPEKLTLSTARHDLQQRTDTEPADSAVAAPLARDAASTGLPGRERVATAGGSMRPRSPLGSAGANDKSTPIDDLAHLSLESSQVFTVHWSLLPSIQVEKGKETLSCKLYEQDQILRFRSTSGQAGPAAWTDFLLDSNQDRNRVIGIHGYPFLQQNHFELLGEGLVHEDFLRNASEALSRSAQDVTMQHKGAALCDEPVAGPTPSEMQARHLNAHVRDVLSMRGPGDQGGNIRQDLPERRERKVRFAADVKSVESINAFKTTQFNQNKEHEGMKAASSPLESFPGQRPGTAEAMMEAVRALTEHDDVELAIACVAMATKAGIDPQSLTVVQNHGHAFAIVGIAPDEKVPPHIADWPHHWAICDVWLNLTCKPSQWQGLALQRLQEWQDREDPKQLHASGSDRSVYSTYPPFLRDFLHSPWNLNQFETLPGRERAARNMVADIVETLSDPFPRFPLLKGHCAQARKFAGHLTSEQVETLSAFANDSKLGAQLRQVMADLTEVLKPAIQPGTATKKGAFSGKSNIEVESSDSAKIPPPTRRWTLGLLKPKSGPKRTSTI